MHVVRTTSAFNVEAVKNNALNKLMAKTIERLDEQLDATLDKHFSFQGEVRDTKTVVDNAARLSAIDKVLNMAGAYVKTQSDAPKHDSVFIEIDPKTGIHKIVIGAPPPALPLESEVTDEVTQITPGEGVAGSSTAESVSGTPALHLIRNHVSAPPESAFVDEDEDVVPELYETAEYEVVKHEKKELPTLSARRERSYIAPSIRPYIKTRSYIRKND